MTYPDKSFNATPEGQRAMFYGESSRSVILSLNRAVKRLGGSSWEESIIQTANDNFLSAIREDLLHEYNKLTKPN